MPDKGFQNLINKIILFKNSVMKSASWCLFLLVLISGCSQIVYDPPEQAPGTVRSPPQGFSKENQYDILQNPFQVVHADQANLIRTKQPIKPLQLLNIDNSIEIKKNGHLILSHFSGLFLEFDMDTTFTILELSKHIKRQLGFENNLVNYRFFIDQLYLEVDKRRLRPTGATTRINFPYEEIKFDLPVKPATRTGRNTTNVCLMWQHPEKVSDAEEYRIDIRNLYNEVIDEFIVERNYHKIDLSKYVVNKSTYLINVYDQNHDNTRSQTLAIIPEGQPYYTPTSCDIKTALQALEIACHMERTNSRLSSRNFFELAAQLSDKPIYSRLLSIYQERSKPIE